MISQPGSSVATSLCVGEAVRKKVGILDIRKKQFRLYAIPLTQVRSFVTTEVSLREHRARLDPEDPNVEKKISALLVEKAQVMVLNAKEDRTKLLQEAKQLGNDAGDEDCPTKFKLLNPDEVLVRIRVEHSGFAAINNQVCQTARNDDLMLTSILLSYLILFHTSPPPAFWVQFRWRDCESAGHPPVSSSKGRQAV
jgi:double-strand break repair protein MRE11